MISTPDQAAAIDEALGIDPADFPDISEAEFTRRFNAMLRIAKLNALLTINELCDPAIAAARAKAHDPGDALTPAQAWDARLREARAAKPPADPDRLRRVIQDRSLRYRSAALALRQPFLKDAADTPPDPKRRADEEAADTPSHLPAFGARSAGRQPGTGVAAGAAATRVRPPRTDDQPVAVRRGHDRGHGDEPERQRQAVAVTRRPAHHRDPVWTPREADTIAVRAVTGQAQPRPRLPPRRPAAAPAFSPLRQQQALPDAYRIRIAARQAPLNPRIPHAA
ncbi:MAG TPA: hypothetical protein VEB22_12020 [Phycisphaerales bacterium]|nr:hypothetical protein [Phycisphaerales bacterium]